MIRKTVILVLVITLGLSAELWVNAIRDPGAELGAGDWETDIREWPQGSGAGDSARVDAHDSSRAYEGEYSFLTDTDKNPGLDYARCHAYCYQCLDVPKAIPDIDSCSWAVYVNESNVLWMVRFWISFSAQSGKTLLWFSGTGAPWRDDTLYSIKFPVPDSGKWLEWGVNFYRMWTIVAGWIEIDTIIGVQVLSEAWTLPYWAGQDVSWDKIFLRSVAYYDYAAESIDSDELADRTYTPIATFANEGIKDDSSAMVYAEILENESVVYKNSQEVSIPAESTEQVEFREWMVPYDGSYTLRVYPILELDEYSADDTLEQTLTGVEEGERSVDVEFVTTRYTQSGVLFSFAPGVSGNLSIYDASGREVYNQSIQPETRELLWITLSIPSGLYFYKIETPTLRLTEKLLIVH